MQPEAQELDLDEQEFQISDAHANGDHDNANNFDDLAGALQEILISQEFESINNDFVRENCRIFEEAPDHSPEQILVFKQYKSQIEEYIEKQLSKRGFGMQTLLENLKELPLDDMLMETLTSLTDFELFRDIMIEARARVEEEERTIKKSTNKATKGYKQAPQNNIFAPSQPSLEVKQLQKPIGSKNQDLRPDLFFSVIPLQTPKPTRKQP